MKIQEELPVKNDEKGVEHFLHYRLDSQTHRLREDRPLQIPQVSTEDYEKSLRHAVEKTRRLLKVRKSHDIGEGQS